MQIFAWAKIQEKMQKILQSCQTTSNKYLGESGLSSTPLASYMARVQPFMEDNSLRCSYLHFRNTFLETVDNWGLVVGLTCDILILLTVPHILVSIQRSPDLLWLVFSGVLGPASNWGFSFYFIES